MLDHAAASFGNGSGTLNLNFGTLHARQWHADHAVPDREPARRVRAGLDLDSITNFPMPAGVFSTDAMSFTDLATAQSAAGCDLILNTSQQGQFTGQYQFNLSDEKDLSGPTRASKR